MPLPKLLKITFFAFSGSFVSSKKSVIVNRLLACDLIIDLTTFWMLLRVAICARQRGNNLSHLNAVYDAHFIFAAFAVFRRPLRGHISAVGHTKLVHETF